MPEWSAEQTMQAQKPSRSVARLEGPRRQCHGGTQAVFKSTVHRLSRPGLVHSGHRPCMAAPLPPRSTTRPTTATVQPCRLGLIAPTGHSCRRAWRPWLCRHRLALGMWVVFTVVVIHMCSGSSLAACNRDGTHTPRPLSSLFSSLFSTKGRPFSLLSPLISLLY